MRRWKTSGMRLLAVAAIALSGTLASCPSIELLSLLDLNASITCGEMVACRMPSTRSFSGAESLGSDCCNYLKRKARCGLRAPIERDRGDRVLRFGNLSKRFVISFANECDGHPCCLPCHLS